MPAPLLFICVLSTGRERTRGTTEPTVRVLLGEGKGTSKRPTRKESCGEGRGASEPAFMGHLSHGHMGYAMNAHR